MNRVKTLFSLFVLFAASALAQTGLSWIPGSSVKLEQVIGDKDWATGAPTTSRTVTRFNVLGLDIGNSFVSGNKTIFVYGDTIGQNVNYHAHDTMAWTTATDGESGMLINFYTNPDGSPMFVEPPGIDMGPDDVPNSGIALADGIYLVVSTGSDVSLPDPHINNISYLVRFDEATQTFTTLRQLSAMPAGHFISTSMHLSGSNVLMFGVGHHRQSDIYLATIPAATFATGAGTQYFAGLVKGQPTWSSSESAAVPVTGDGTVGNVSVTWSPDLGLWLMTYDGGRGSPATEGVYFAYAEQPWGPWSTPQLIFNPTRDHGLGVFIHNPSAVPSDGLNGPTIGANDPVTTRGTVYAPLTIERFTTVSGKTLKIYYGMATWNPYTIVKMRSEFTIERRHRAAKH